MLHNFNNNVAVVEVEKEATVEKQVEQIDMVLFKGCLYTVPQGVTRFEFLKELRESAYQLIRFGKDYSPINRANIKKDLKIF